MNAFLEQPALSQPAPLVVDLDGTLIRGDLLHESALKLLRLHPAAVALLPAWLLRGKAALKDEIAARVGIEAATLPYHPELLDWLKAQKQAGRRLVLCTASNERYAQQVAEHLGLFDEVIASNGQDNVSARRKAEILAQRYGEKGFDYAGNSSDDLHVWARAREAILVNTPAGVAAAAQRQFKVAGVFPGAAASLRTWLRALRLHQWLKNLLVLLPLAGAFQMGQGELLQAALMAFLAFGLCASSVYVLNDLMDMESDRQHPRKRERPFAAGVLSPVAGLAVAALLLLGSAALAAASRPAFQLALASYFALTLAYTFVLKRKVIVDCLTLGTLYTLRIVAGWSAVGLPASFWLLAFSLFLFLSLAFVKRYSELQAVVKAGKADAAGRGYLGSDLPLVQTMGVSAGFCSAMLLALYINGDTVMRTYTHPELLWLTVPILLYWVSRMWMQAQRGHMHDDPVVFAVRDPISLACAALFGLTLAASR